MSQDAAAEETPNPSQEPQNSEKPQEKPESQETDSPNCCFTSILDWPGEVWAFMILRLSLAMRFITAGIEKFRGPQYRLNMEEMKGANSTPELFQTKIEDFVHGELAEKYEGDNGLDPEKLKEAFGPKFFDQYVEHFEKPVIDFAKLPGGDPAGIKEVLDLFIQDDLTPMLEGDNGLDMEKVASTFGEKFANNSEFFVKEGSDTYFSEKLADILVETPKDQLGDLVGADGVTGLVKFIGDEYGRHVIQSGTQFSNKFVELLASTTDPNKLASTLGKDAHAQIIDGVKKSITHFGPDSIDTSYVYNLDHYAFKSEKFLEVQETWYANFPLMPKWSLAPFVHSLGYLLLIIGFTTLLGVKSRLSLTAMALLYLALSFGAGLLVAAGAAPLVQNNVLFLSLFFHLFLTVFALTLSKHEKFALVK
jgi:hypothetical protein